MSVLKDKELFTSIDNSELFNLYFLYGRERYFLNEAVKRIKNKALNGGDESFNLSVFEEEKPNMSKVYDAVEALPVFASVKCVILKGIDIQKLSASDLQALTDIAQNVPDSTVLIIVPIFDGEKNLSQKAKKIADIASKNGALCEFDYLSRSTLKSYLAKMAKKQGSLLSENTADFLIERCGEDCATLLSELSKLTSFKPGLEITKEDIIACCAESLDFSAFDMTKSIIKKDFSKAHLILSKLISQRAEPTMIIGALSTVFTDLYRAKCAKLKNKDNRDMVSDFKYPKYKEKSLYYTFKDAASVSEKQLCAYIEAIFETDILLKSSSLDSEFLLQEMLFKMQNASLN